MVACNGCSVAGETWFRSDLFLAYGSTFVLADWQPSMDRVPLSHVRYQRVRAMVSTVDPLQKCFYSGPLTGIPIGYEHERWKSTIHSSTPCTLLFSRLTQVHRPLGGISFSCACGVRCEARTSCYFLAILSRDTCKGPSHHVCGSKRIKRFTCCDLLKNIFGCCIDKFMKRLPCTPPTDLALGFTDTVAPRSWVDQISWISP